MSNTIFAGHKKRKARLLGQPVDSKSKKALSSRLPNFASNRGIASFFNKV